MVVAKGLSSKLSICSKAGMQGLVLLILTSVCQNSQPWLLERKYQYVEGSAKSYKAQGVGSTTCSNQGVEEMHPSASPSLSPLLPARGVSHECYEEYGSDHGAVRLGCPEHSLAGLINLPLSVL